MYYYKTETNKNIIQFNKRTLIKKSFMDFIHEKIIFLEAIC